MFDRVIPLIGSSAQVLGMNRATQKLSHSRKSSWVFRPQSPLTGMYAQCRRPIHKSGLLPPTLPRYGVVGNIGARLRLDGRVFRKLFTLITFILDLSAFALPSAFRVRLRVTSSYLK